MEKVEKVKETKEEVIDTKQYDIYQKLAMVQQELNVPKAKWNKFGEFWYRSCEDILMAVKPYLKKYNLLLKVSDKVEMVGNWVYITAVVVLTDLDADRYITNEASARESDIKKGMDASQLTGTASSYARKYALNGMFLLDDSKDADTDEFHKEQNGQAGDEPQKKNGGNEPLATDNQKRTIVDIYKNDVNAITKILSELGKKNVNELTLREASDIISKKMLKK